MHSTQIEKDVCSCIRYRQKMNFGFACFRKRLAKHLDEDEGLPGNGSRNIFGKVRIWTESNKQQKRRLRSCHVTKCVQVALFYLWHSWHHIHLKFRNRMFRPSHKFATNYVKHGIEAFVVTCEVLLSLDNIYQKKATNARSLMGTKRKRYSCLFNRGVKTVYSGTFFNFTTLCSSQSYSSTCIFIAFFWFEKMLRILYPSRLVYSVKAIFIEILTFFHFCNISQSWISRTH